MEPMRHLACGGTLIPRWVIADDGDHVIIAWCEACDMAIGPGAASRPITPEDIPPAMIEQWPGLKQPN